MVPDYYAMLGVDPRADRPTLEAALARCQPAWSAGTRNPKNKHTYQSYLDQIPALRQALLGDPTARAAYDAERAAAARIDREEKLAALNKQLRLRAAKGGLTVSDRALLRNEALRLGLGPDDLDRLAESIPPRPEAPGNDDAPDPPADVLDPTTRRQVRVALEHLRKRDLYDVLDLPHDAPTAEIAARADAERRRWMHKSQVTAEKTAWLEAITYALSHMTTPAARARYDRTLVIEAEEALAAAARFALGGLSRLDEGTRAALLDEAAALGIVPERAERLIGRACRAAGVARDNGHVAALAVAPPRLLRCQSCSGVTEFSRAAKDLEPACRHCGAPLRWDCPACRRPHWVDEAACACGFPREHREPLVKHFEAAQHAFKARDYAAALDHLQRVQDFAPHHVGARKGARLVEEQLAQIERARSTFQTERARRHLVAARGAVEAWARLVPATLPELRAAWNEVTNGLRQAYELTQRARALMLDEPSTARDLFRQALAIASDLPEARDGLRRCPPGPPSDLMVSLDGDKLRLRWTAPPPDFLGPVSYRVVRKRQGVPNHPGDGTLVAEVAATECDDPAAPAGESVGYAVFSRRAETDSLTGATAVPRLVLANVTQARARVSDGEVLLGWTAPPGAVEVRVVRKLGAAPMGPEDGETVPSGRDRARDRGVHEDQVAYYGIYALYRGPDGRSRTSHGVVVTAIPGEPFGLPPAAPVAPGVADPSDLRAVRVGHTGRAQLRWQWPPGVSRVLVLAKAGAHADGPGDGDAIREEVRAEDYHRHGHHVLVLPPSPTGAWHVSVFGVAVVEGERRVSPGREATARTVVPGPNPEVVVSYILRRGRVPWPGRPWWLTFRTEPPGALVPPTALVANRRAVPLSADDGQVVAQFPAARDGATFRVRSRVRLGAHRARVFADPRADPDGHPPIRLRHPEVEGTRA